MSKLRKAQTMVEYILIVALIAIALIGVFTAVAKAIGKKAAGAAAALSTSEGEAATTEVTNISKDNIKSLGED